MSAQDDRTFVYRFSVIIGTLATIAIITGICVNIAVDYIMPHDQTARQVENVKQRTQPVFQVVTNPNALKKVSASQSASASSSAKPMPPKEIFSQVCSACHTTGAMGAPKVTDKAEWSKRLDENGRDGLHHAAINGIGNMPPKGGHSELTDKEVKKTVDYILKRAGAT